MSISILEITLAAAGLLVVVLFLTAFFKLRTQEPFSCWQQNVINQQLS
jgi:hypothetical protein